MSCRCYICKKEISEWTYNLEEYIYKKEDKYFCSYNCYRKFEKMQHKPSIKMEWVKETDNSIIASGNEGMFRIEFDGLYYNPIYLGYDGVKEKFKKFRHKVYAKACCENSEYWEEWENEKELEV